MSEEKLSIEEQIALAGRISLKILLNEIRMRREVEGKTPMEIVEMIETELPEDKARAREILEYENDDKS